ncbi:MAG: PLP-dependent transferase [Phycisphaerales bacterium]|nr:PLP-dependent transferase [Phycisphaerales bacterium]
MKGFDTRAVRAAIDSDREHGAVIPPLHLSSNFAFAGFGEKRAYDYTRSGNPTRDHLAAALADLEGGARAVVTPTGMAAIALVLQLVKPGEVVLAPHDCYGGTFRLLSAWARRGLVTVEFVDHDEAGALREALRRRPRLVWLETPSNPLLRVVDIAAIAAAARVAGALTVADNTFLSPVLQQPLALGADVVVHSTTKYINGHSDVVGGAVVSRDQALGDELAWWANCVGITGAPFDSFLTLRGLRTLPLRMRQHEANAAAVAALLSDHPAVARVHYPGLPNDPGHALAARQQRGFGGMLSFALRGGEAAVRAFLGERWPTSGRPSRVPTLSSAATDAAAAVARHEPPSIPRRGLLDGLAHFTLAESLGGVESLVAHPATMTHASMDAAARSRAGIGDGLLRLSVGIEDAADLCADLAAGLRRAQSVREGCAQR